MRWTRSIDQQDTHIAYSCGGNLDIDEPASSQYGIELLVNDSLIITK